MECRDRAAALRRPSTETARPRLGFWLTTTALLPLMGAGSALAESLDDRRRRAPAGTQVAQAAVPPATANDPAVLPNLTIDGTRVLRPDETYKADVSSSPKMTAPLLDTPKSVTIITQRQMEERGAQSLVDVLRTTPGITLGSGEGGTPVGDRPFIRGFEASTDLMIDGMRDLGRFTHESFNLESVEISKGPGSAYSGRGSTGGTINMVSKAPRAENFFHGSGTIGTDSTKRVTLDGNYVVTEGVGLRLNAMTHTADVAGRDALESERFGLAPSLTLGLGGPTRATFSFYHLKTDEIPDLGIPFDPTTGRPANVSRDNYYGLVQRDFRETEANVGTLKLEHDFSNGLKLSNTTRQGTTTNDYIMTRPTMTGNSPAAGTVDRNARSRISENEFFINQTDLRANFNTGFIRHTVATGLEYSKEELRSGSFNIIPNTGATPLGDLYNPNFNDAYTAAISRGSLGTPTTTKTKAAYVFDTLQFNDQWSLNLGLRYDDYDVTDGTVSRSDRFFNYQGGVVYKPLPNASIYISYGTSSNPSGETAGQSGGADGAAGGGLGGNRINLEPEKNRSYEIGTKWDLFGNRLSLTGAVFRTEKTNQRAADPNGGAVELIGNSQTDGIEIGVAGSITDQWQVFGGYTYLDAKLKDDGAGTNDGKQLKYIAPNSFSLWSTYAITRDLTVGGGAYYMSERYMNDANTLELPSHWRFDAMASYRVNQHIGLQLNVRNLTDETIYDGSHVGLFANVAPGRSALLTTNVKF